MGVRRGEIDIDCTVGLGARTGSCSHREGEENGLREPSENQSDLDAGAPRGRGRLGHDNLRARSRTRFQGSWSAVAVRPSTELRGVSSTEEVNLIEGRSMHVRRQSANCAKRLGAAWEDGGSSQVTLTVDRPVYKILMRTVHEV